MKINKIIANFLLPLFLCLSSTPHAEEDKKVDQDIVGKKLRWEVTQQIKEEKLMAQWIANFRKGKPHLIQDKHIQEFKTQLKVGN